MSSQRSRTIGLLAALSLAVLAPPVAAYTPGSGTIYTTNFETLDADWEQGNNIDDCPWTQIIDGTDKSFYADGRGQLPSSPTRHRTKHFVHPVAAESFSMAMEFRAELGSGYLFDLAVQQRAPTLRAYRLRVDPNGALSIWRSEAGAMVQKVSSSNGVVPVNQRRWIRFAIETNGAGGHWVRARVWSGGASAEPTAWTLSYQDPIRTIERAHRFELFADGPKGIETWIDDLDAYGAGSAGTDSSIRDIYIVEHSHLDIGFTLPADDIETFAKTHLDQVLGNLAGDPDYRWTIESSWFLDRWWERSTPTEQQNLVSWLQNGRLRLAAGYANLHTTVAGHEELTRNIYHASRFARQHQIPLRTWITNDVPGTTFAVPELLHRAGIDYFVGGMNTPFGGATVQPNMATRPFWWQGPDGSKTLSWITFDAYAEAFNWGFSFFDALPDVWRNTGREMPKLEEVGYPYPELLLMRAFDNHYQGYKARDLIAQWNATYQTPRFHLSTVDEFLDMMRAKYGDASFPTFAGDWGAAWSATHAGDQYTTTLVRSSHRDGRAAEALLGVAEFGGGAAVPQTDFDQMYRRQLEVDEHSGAGSWPGYWNQEQMQRNNQIHLDWAIEARDRAAQLLALGEQRFTAAVPATGDALIVVNSLARSRDGWVKAALPPALFATTFRLVERPSGVEIPYQRFSASSEILFRAAAVPSLGYRVYDLVPGAPTAAPSGMLTAAGNTVENDFYRLTVDPSDGAVSSLIEKATGRELVDGAAGYRFNRLASNVTNEINAANNPLAHAVGSASVTIETTGPLMAGLKVTRTGTPHVQSLYRLYRGEDRVELVNTLDRNQMPYVPNSIGTRAYMVTLPFDVQNFALRTETTTRFLDPLADRFDRTSSFDWHNTEHSLHFWDGEGGIAYACDTVNSHFFEKLKTFGPALPTLSKGMLLPRLYDRVDEYEFEDGSIGPFVMEPGAPALYTSTHHLRATPPSFDPVAASRFGFESLTPLREVLIGARAGTLPGDAASFLSVLPANVLLYTVKGADDHDGLILRLTEMSGVVTTAQISSGRFALGNALRVEQDEEGGAALVASGGVVEVPLGPYETATVRVRIVPAGEVSLQLVKHTASGSVALDWTGGGPAYTLRRAEDPQFTIGVTTLFSGSGTSFDDPVLDDGLIYYYRVE